MFCLSSQNIPSNSCFCFHPLFKFKVGLYFVPAEKTNTCTIDLHTGKSVQDKQGNSKNKNHLSPYCRIFCSYWILSTNCRGQRRAELLYLLRCRLSRVLLKWSGWILLNDLQTNVLSVLFSLFDTREHWRPVLLNAVCAKRCGFVGLCVCHICFISGTKVIMRLAACSRVERLLSFC